MATPVIEAGDITTSVSDTLDASPATISLPSYNNGDLVIIGFATDTGSVTHTLPTAGPNSETINTIVANNTAGGAGGPDSSAFWYVATANETTPTIDVTMDSSARWYAGIIVVPTGEFDTGTPIQANDGNSGSSSATTTGSTPTWTADATADGRVVGYIFADTQSLSGTATGWTVRENTDHGRVGMLITTRDAANTASESIAAADYTIDGGGDTYTSIGFIVNEPAGGTNVDANATGAAASAAAGTASGTGAANASPSGAAAAAEAGTATSTATSSSVPQLAPWGLVTKARSAPVRPISVTLSGKASAASAGGVIATAETSSNPRQLAPTGLAVQPRDFQPKGAGTQNVNATVTGAAIVGQWSEPDANSTSIYPDGEEILAESGSVDITQGKPLGAEAGADAGTVTVSVSIDAAATGADADAIGATVTAVAGTGAVDANATPTGGEAGADAGTVTINNDFAVSITGKQINGQGSQPGQQSRTNTSVTIGGAAADAEAAAPTLSGPHVTVNLEGVSIVGQAGNVAQRKKGGISRKKSRRLVVEIDGQFFDVDSPQQAQQLLERAAQAAEESVEEIVSEPVIRVRTLGGAPTRSIAVQRTLNKTRKRINQAFVQAQNRRNIDNEISRLMLDRIAQEEDEEESLLALML